MELEELKNVWSSIDERLKKQESLRECIVKEMIYSKTNKSLKRLLWSDSISIPILLLVVPFIVYAYGKFGGKHIVWDSTVILAGVFVIVYFPILVYRVYGLMKIDLSGNIKNNLYYINRYSLQVNREKIFMKFFGPVLLILISLVFIEAKADAFRWVIWICLVVFVTLYSYWSYNKFYRKNIQSIQNNLEELGDE